MSKEIFLLAGEASGDLHGSALLRELKQQQSDLTFVGVGGPLMRESGLNLFLPMEEFEVFGFAEVVLNLPRIIKQFKRIKEYILKSRPAAVVLIDYPGFNIRLATSLRKSGYTGKIVQYISPSVWAWGKGRIPKMAASYDLLLTILPFESAYFKESGLETRFVGHPLIEKIQNYNYTAPKPFPSNNLSK